MKSLHLQEAGRIRRQPTRAELLHEIKILRNEQRSLVEEIKQLLASVSIYRDLAERALRIRETNSEEMARPTVITPNRKSA